MLRAFRAWLNTPTPPRRVDVRVAAVNDLFLGNAFITRQERISDMPHIRQDELEFLLDALTVPNLQEGCPICLESNVSPVIQICEGHYFCRACISQWLRRNNTCPICRSLIVREK
jgi:hypothetical protein